MTHHEDPKYTKFGKHIFFPYLRDLRAFVVNNSENKRCSAVDRSVEHLGASDAFIIQLRRFLQRAIKEVQAGKDAPGTIFDSQPRDYVHLRREAADLPADVSWRTLYSNAANS